MRKEYSWDLTATFCTKETLHDPNFVFSCDSSHVHIKWRGEKKLCFKLNYVQLSVTTIKK